VGSNSTLHILLQIRCGDITFINGFDLFELPIQIILDQYLRAISTNTLKPITSIQNTVSKTEKLKYNKVYPNILNGKFRKLPDFGKFR